MFFRKSNDWLEKPSVLKMNGTNDVDVNVGNDTSVSYDLGVYGGNCLVFIKHGRGAPWGIIS